MSDIVDIHCMHTAAKTAKLAVIQYAVSSNNCVLLQTMMTPWCAFGPSFAQVLLFAHLLLVCILV